MEKKIQINNYFFISLIIFNFMSSQEKWNYSAEEMDQTKINGYSIRRLKENVRFVKTDQIMLTDKKSSNTEIGLVLIKGIGKPYINQGSYFYHTSREVIEEFLKEFMTMNAYVEENHWIKLKEE